MESDVPAPNVLADDTDRADNAQAVNRSVRGKRQYLILIEFFQYREHDIALRPVAPFLDVGNPEAEQKLMPVR